MTRVPDSTPFSMTNGRFLAPARAARTASDTAQAVMKAVHAPTTAARCSAANAARAFISPTCAASRSSTPNSSANGAQPNNANSP